MSSPFIRGAVSGIGAVTVVAGLAELNGLIGHGRRASGDDPAATDSGAT
jgi:hypothetical protein